MNRAERRRQAKHGTPIVGAVRRADEAQRVAERELLAQAEAIAASIPAPGETLAIALRDLAAGIRDLEANPMTRLVAGPALDVLRRRRDELAAL